MLWRQQRPQAPYMGIALLFWCPLFLLAVQALMHLL
jgi:hypothetical protein